MLIDGFEVFPQTPETGTLRENFNVTRLSGLILGWSMLGKGNCEAHWLHFVTLLHCMVIWLYRDAFRFGFIGKNCGFGKMYRLCQGVSGYANWFKPE